MADSLPLLHPPPPSAESQGGSRAAKKRLQLFVKNVVMGASDGSTVPFALAAGIASQAESSEIIVVAVVAELAAGFIAMGLGGYMSADVEETMISSELDLLTQLFTQDTREMHARLTAVLSPLRLPAASIAASVNSLKPAEAAAFVLRNEMATEDDDLNPLASAATVGLAYVIAGAIPSLPYFFIEDAATALTVSIPVGIASLLVFGYVKGHLTGGNNRAEQALQTALLGAFAAATAYALSASIA